MVSTTKRAYGGQSADARRRQRRERLLDAAMEVMTRNEWRGVTVEKLCAAANLNKRYFYESFTDLDALAAAVVDDIADGVRSATVAAADATAQQSLEVQALASVAAAVRALVDDPRRARVLLGGVAALPEFDAHRTTVMHRLTDVLIDHGRSVHGVELEKDPLAKVAPAFIVGGTADAILEFVNGGVDLSLDDFIAQLATLWLITGNGAAQLARGRIASS
ncbi:TetR/AcrR family transcriptional regulator [Mycolicibacterium fortuitum]|uniref:TetR/AcrR family transcriptional regulator n=1 Tax=Mycolicibacterium fortuitum TaxID=1766 RepID=UPI0007EB41BD|nr:TetR/AcrR family transcriptional regulator [Mycolicibacterium fortuitum]OBB49526.1 transcriptional regulator [Mycolicibacterium fortuitum]OBB50638.1 transcriptional regulator [Mycolicibacterium fortuitum]OBF75847.1 transcriptional regulator [Mycolicibacterium fortuitum]OBK03344.1 transcriptional regulator [Mycolicibacterium fortuitum]OMC12738.1 transcriptional regulator [Mycolicibacterium fortuitum]